MKIVSNLIGEMVELRLRTRPYSKDSGTFVEVRGIVRAVYTHKTAGICVLIEARDNDSGELKTYALETYTVRAVLQCKRCTVWYPKHNVVPDGLGSDMAIVHACKPGVQFGCRAKEKS